MLLVYHFHHHVAINSYTNCDTFDLQFEYDRQLLPLTEQFKLVILHIVTVLASS